jgi:hypothetical protein
MLKCIAAQVPKAGPEGAPSNLSSYANPRGTLLLIHVAPVQDNALASCKSGHAALLAFLTAANIILAYPDKAQLLRQSTPQCGLSCTTRQHVVFQRGMLQGLQAIYCTRTLGIHAPEPGKPQRTMRTTEQLVIALTFDAVL